MKRSFTVRQGALDGVEAFLGVARHHSFRKAADELGVTTSAVSQAIRALIPRGVVPIVLEPIVGSFCNAASRNREAPIGTEL
jgi:hypothetical protein